MGVLSYYCHDFYGLTLILLDVILTNATSCIILDRNTLGNGACDSESNNEACAWDWGDCCPCTCVSGLYTCGVGGYNCLSAACANAAASSGKDLYHNFIAGN